MTRKTARKAASAADTTKTAGLSPDVAQEKPKKAAATPSAKAKQAKKTKKISRRALVSPALTKARRSGQPPHTELKELGAAGTQAVPGLVDTRLLDAPVFAEMAVPPPPPPPRGAHYCLGIVAGSDSPEFPRVRPIGDFATDLCEIAPSGQVALAGDTFTGDAACPPGGQWSPSMGLHVRPGTLSRRVEFDDKFGGCGDLYDQPCWPGQSQLPAGTVQVRVGDRVCDYALVTRTRTTEENGRIVLRAVNSRLVVIDPSRPRWRTVPNSEKPADWQWSNQTQISGCQAPDGWVYIVADSFSRDKPVVLYHCHPDTFENRDTWWAWAQVPGDPERWEWDQDKVRPTPLNDDHFGELSLRIIEGKYVLSGFNETTGQVEVRVADDVTQVLAGPRADYDGTPVTVVVDQAELPHCYGGYIVPGSTLDEARILVSQWGTDDTPETKNYPYTVREYVVNLNRS